MSLKRNRHRQQQNLKEVLVISGLQELGGESVERAFCRKLNIFNSHFYYSINKRKIKNNIFF